MLWNTLLPTGRGGRWEINLPFKGCHFFQLKSLLKVNLVSFGYLISLSEIFSTLTPSLSFFAMKPLDTGGVYLTSWGGGGEWVWSNWVSFVGSYCSQLVLPGFRELTSVTTSSTVGTTCSIWSWHREGVMIVVQELKYLLLPNRHHLSSCWGQAFSEASLWLF